jgi:hypothetical protein
MAEAAFRYVQIGKETTFGTAVQGTIILPLDVGSAEFTLNRAYDIPDEDFGTMIQHLNGRGSYGVRVATGSLSMNGSFELAPYILDMAIGSAVTSGTASPYTHTFTADGTADTAHSYTFRTVDTVQPWVTAGVQVQRFDLGFDNIDAGTNSMWKLNADLQAASHVKGTATASLSAPTTIQTMEGHLTTLSEGPSGTAFASLGELTASLVQYRLSVDQAKPLRPYGGTADFASAHGDQKRVSTVAMMLKVSSTVITDIWDIFNVSGALPTDRRARIVSSGSNSASLTIDHLLEYTDVHISPNERNGERLVAVTANCLYDSTLASDLVIAIQNGTSSY